jgi:hypothetical protein
MGFMPGQMTFLVQRNITLLLPWVVLLKDLASDRSKPYARKWNRLPKFVTPADLQSLRMSSLQLDSAFLAATANLSAATTNTKSRMAADSS